MRDVIRDAFAGAPLSGRVRSPERPRPRRDDAAARRARPPGRRAAVAARIAGGGVSGDELRTRRAGDGRRGRARRLSRRRAAGARGRRASSTCAPSASAQLEPQRAPMQEGTIFDLSSLTKPLATSARVDAAGARRQGAPRRSRDALLPQLRRATGRRTSPSAICCATPPGCRPGGRTTRTILQIERSGEKVNFLGSDGGQGVRLPADQPRAARSAGRARKAVYSDLGFMLLGALVEDGQRHDARPLLPGAHLPAARPARDRRSSICRWCARGASSRSPT